MRAVSVILCIWSGLVFASAHASHSETVPLDRLNQQVLDLVRKYNYTQAGNLAEQAVAAARSQRGEKDPDTIKALVQQGHVLIMLGRGSEAETAAKRAIEIAEETQPADSELLADALETLGATALITLELHADPADIGALQRALVIREKHIKSNPYAYLALFDQMTTFIVAPKAPEGCARMFVRAIGIAESELGLGHPVIAGLLDRLGQLLSVSAFETGEFTSLDRVTDTQKRVMAVIKDSGRAQSLRSIPEPPRPKYALFEGERYFNASRDIMDRLLASAELDRLEPQAILALLSPLRDLSKHLEETGRAGEAERLYIMIRDVPIQKVNTRQAAVQADGWPSAMEDLLGLYRNQNRLDAFEKLAVEATAQVDEQLATADPPTESRTRGSRIFRRLANDYEELGNPARAEHYWNKIIAMFEAQGDLEALAVTLADTIGIDPNNEQFLFRIKVSPQGMAGFYERQGRWDEAEAAYRRAVDILVQRRGADDTLVTTLKRRLSLFLERRPNAAARQAQ